MRVSEFDYHLPTGLIAQKAAEPRDHARLMVLERATDGIEHRHFYDLPEYLGRRDVLVINDTKVLPYRLSGQRWTGGRLDGLILERLGENRARALLKSHGRLTPGETVLFFDQRLRAKLLEKDDEGVWTMEFETPGSERLVEEFGRAPLPPYIRRAGEDNEIIDYDRRRYQTVFACVPGAVAAPTAGMHFTDALLERIASGGTEIVHVTLHVGLGTFKPVKAQNIENHRMHAERYELSEEAGASLNAALAAGKRIVAVGTTSVRVLEHCARCGRFQAGTGSTDLFICPGYQFRLVRALVTNFHLPKSTLLMLVAAFAGTERVLRAYEVAVKERYRFYSYGDAMLIL